MWCRAVYEVERALAGGPLTQTGDMPQDEAAWEAYLAAADRLAVIVTCCAACLIDNVR